MAKLVKVRDTMTDADTWINWDMVSSVREDEGGIYRFVMVNGDVLRVKGVAFNELGAYTVKRTD